jgi:CheY-like chemotaxis protein
MEYTDDDDLTPLPASEADFNNRDNYSQPPEIALDRPENQMVLAISDKDILCRLIYAILQREQIKVIIIGNTYTNIHATIAKEKPALILFDGRLANTPEGHRLYLTIHNSDQLGQIPIVMMLAANKHSLDQQRARLVGAKDYLRMPFDSTTLLTLVHKYLR